MIFECALENLKNNSMNSIIWSVVPSSTPAQIFRYFVNSFAISSLINSFSTLCWSWLADAGSFDTWKDEKSHCELNGSPWKKCQIYQYHTFKNLSSLYEKVEINLEPKHKSSLPVRWIEVSNVNECHSTVVGQSNKFWVDLASQCIVYENHHSALRLRGSQWPYERPVASNSCKCDCENCIFVIAISFMCMRYEPA